MHVNMVFTLHVEFPAAETEARGEVVKAFYG